MQPDEPAWWPAVAAAKTATLSILPHARLGAAPPRHRPRAAARVGPAGGALVPRLRQRGEPPAALIREQRAQLRLRHAAWVEPRVRVGVGEAADEEPAARPDEAAQPVEVGALRRVVQAVEERRVERHLEAAQLARARLHLLGGAQVDGRRLHVLGGARRGGDRARHLVALAALARRCDGARAEVEAQHVVPARRKPVGVVAGAAAAVEDRRASGTE